MNPIPFTPSNDLEQALVRAASDPSARPEFYRKLLEADLFLLTPNAPQQDGKFTLEKDEQISFVNWQGNDGTFLPMFSSLYLLQTAIQSADITYGYLALNGKVAFEIFAQKANEIILNPGFAYGKQFVLEEIRQIADGSLFAGNPRTVSKATTVLLGQPAKYPHTMVSVLQNLFQKYPQVKAACLAQMHDPSSGEPPHIVVGIECSDDYRTIVSDVGIAVKGEVEGEFVDFIEVEGGKGSLNHYFKKQTKPFYQTSAKPRWKFWK